MKSLIGGSHEVLFQRAVGTDSYSSDILFNFQKTKRHRRDISFFLDEKTYEAFQALVRSEGIVESHVMEELIKFYISFHRK